MKKVIILAIFLSFVFAGSAMAAASPLLATASQDGMELWADTPVDALIGKCSKGVRVAVTFNATAYALSTVHKSGSKYYGTAFDGTALFVKSPVGDINATFAAPAESVTDLAFPDGEGWDAL